MKVTKYPQSCLIIEDHGKRLIIDPGAFVSQKFKAADLLPVDAILLTHEHQDHVDPELIKSLKGDSKIPVIGNQSTKDTVGGDIVSQVVSDQEEFEAAGFKITARELPHVAMVDGSPGPQNTGYVIDDVFFHPGDGIEIENLKIEKTAVPIAGPDVSPRDIFSFIKQVGAKKVIPIHYDYFPNDPEFVANMLGSSNSALGGLGKSVEVIVLANGQSAEI